jgi:hypothetical protein
MQELLIAIISALLGWWLTQVVAYFTGRVESEQALWLLEGEVQTIRTQITLASDLVNKANDLRVSDPEQAIQKADNGQALITTLQPIVSYRDKFNGIARGVRQPELDVAKYVVTYQCYEACLPRSSTRYFWFDPF